MWFLESWLTALPVQSRCDLALPPSGAEHGLCFSTERLSPDGSPRCRREQPQDACVAHDSTRAPLLAERARDRRGSPSRGKQP